MPNNTANPYTAWLICFYCDDHVPYADDWRCKCGYTEVRNGTIYAHPRKET